MTLGLMKWLNVGPVVVSFVTRGMNVFFRLDHQTYGIY
jgi:hypothetical protein